jgi:Sigma-70, region 4
MEPDQTFAKLFTFAQVEALDPRARQILALRYGLPSAMHHTLAEVGKQQLVSQERIRQIVAKSLRKIRAKASRDLIEGRIRASAALILYVERMCRPNEPEYLDRYRAFAQRALPLVPQFTTALPLLMALVPPSSKAPHLILRDLREMRLPRAMAPPHRE